LFHAVKLPQDSPWRFEAIPIDDVRKGRNTIALMFLLLPLVHTGKAGAPIKELIYTTLKGVPAVFSIAPPRLCLSLPSLALPGLA